VCCRQPRRLYASRYCELESCGSGGLREERLDSNGLPFNGVCGFVSHFLSFSLAGVLPNRGIRIRSFLWPEFSLAGVLPNLGIRFRSSNSLHSRARQAATDARAHRSRVVAAARNSQRDVRRFRRGESAARPPHSDGTRAAPKGHGS